jgi:hypothetical protein
MLAPIVLFVYNRPEHTQQTINALKANYLADKSELFIFSDGAKNEKASDTVAEVRQLIRTIDGFKKVEVFEAPQNKGLANSVIYGVSKVIEQYGKAIVLEDDLLTSQNFLPYMNQALDFYEKNPKIWSISAYNPPIKIPSNYDKDIYFSYRGCSWGWATWRDRWLKNDWAVKDYQKFVQDPKAQVAFNRGGHDMVEMLRDQMDGQMDSWAIRWCYSQFKDSSYTVYPLRSKVQNIGYDGSGTHCESSTTRNVSLDSFNQTESFPDQIELNEEILKEFRDFYQLNFLKKLKKITKDLGVYNLAKPAKKLLLDRK